MGKGRYYGYLIVHYPLSEGELLLRTEVDWDADQAPESVSEDGTCFAFLIEHERPYIHCKPVIRRGETVHWAKGANKLIVLGESPQRLNPHFFGGDKGKITSLTRRPSVVLERELRLRLYLPPGYEENYLKRYPVIYMHDGRNLFFPHESFLGQEWKINENLDLLDSMNLIDQAIVVGVHAGDDRNGDYTSPGYEAYGRALVRDLKPWVDANWRTLPGPEDTSVMGSSLGGVVSFYLAWEHPDVFGNAACLSSTFGWRDDLLERIRDEGREGRFGLRFYLDSGWPGDNYEATVTMASALLERGFERGRDLLHLVFPYAPHSEASWAARVHLPLQLISGKARRTGERQRRPSPTSALAARCLI